MSKWKDKNNNSKLEAFARLEASRKAATELIDYEAEREKVVNEKYSIVDWYEYPLKNSEIPVITSADFINMYR